MPVIESVFNRERAMKPLILIVEDEPSIADNIRYALETEGFDTEWHAAGRDVLSSLVAKTVDLIVLDVGLPDVSGMELCKEIRKISQVPVIFLTARSDEIDRVVGLEIGADDYMVKPFSPRELTARIRAVLRRTSPGVTENGNEEGANGFTVDTERQQITWCSVPLELSRYEFRILEIFIRRPGRIYSREKLMQMVWEDPEMSLDRTVDAHIKNIRAKLKQVAPEKDPIKTHRGIGYSLKEGL